jgi:hypothetical protein
VGLFGRSKPLHERLAEEADLDIGQGPPREPRAFTGFLHDLAGDTVGIHGVARPRRWDAVTSAAAPLPGDAVHFTALPDGTLVVDEDVPDDSLLPLAAAVEKLLEPPYRAQGVRQEDGVWALAANRIQVRQLPGVEEDELELIEPGQIVLGRRIDGDLFEVEISPL